jgi:hypothetical protein
VRLGWHAGGARHAAAYSALTVYAATVHAGDARYAAAYSASKPSRRLAKIAK